MVGRRSFRAIRTRPLLSAVIVATLALGLGVNAAIFSLTREVLLRPLPYRDADRLVRVFETSSAFGRVSVGVSPFSLEAWRTRVDAFETLAAFRRVAFNVATDIDAVQLEGFRVSPSFFRVLGVAPSLGRDFSEADAVAGRDSVIIISDGMWRAQFAADPHVAGRSLTIDGTPCTIVGVLPQTYTIFHVLGREVSLYRPLVFDPTDREQSIGIYARLRDGASAELARAQLQTAYAAMATSDRPWNADVMALSTSFAAQSRPVLLALQSAVGLVLFVACVNIANLLLAVAIGRRKELAVRSALGAGPWRIARDLAGETSMLTLAGTVAAVLLATWVVAALNTVISFQDVNRLHPFQVDRSVIAVAAVIAALVAGVFAIVPAHAATRVDVNDALKAVTGVTSTSAHRPLRSTLVIGELAVAIVLSSVALSLSRGVIALHTMTRGFDGEGVMTAQVSLTAPRYADVQMLTRTATSMLTAVAATNGVSDAAIVNYPPVAVIGTSVPIAVDGFSAPANRPPVGRYWVVSPNYFRTLRIPLLAGRDFSAADDADARGVVIVSEAFAQRFWNTRDAIGRQLTPLFPDSNAFWIPRTRRRALTVVGIVADVREDGLPEAAGQQQFYVPYAQNPTIVLTLMARTSPAAAEIGSAAIRNAVRAVDWQAPVGYEASLTGVMRETFTRPRETAWLVTIFAALALMLSAIGVYGVMAQLAAARAHEISIRIALGAGLHDILRLVLRQAAAMTVAGLLAGIVAAPIATAVARAWLFGMQPADPIAVLTVAFLIGTIAVAAAAIPAIRAARRGLGTAPFI